MTIKLKYIEDSKNGRYLKKQDMSSNKDNKTNEERTNTQKSSKARENLTSSDVNLSMGDVDKDPNEVYQDLKTKLKFKQVELK